MLALNTMSPEAQLVLSLIALVLFGAAAVISLQPRPVNWWGVLVGAGGSLLSIIILWNAVAAT